MYKNYICVYIEIKLPREESLHILHTSIPIPLFHFTLEPFKHKFVVQINRKDIQPITSLYHLFYLKENLSSIICRMTLASQPKAASTEVING